MEGWVTHTGVHGETDSTIEWSEEYYRITDRRGIYDEGVNGYGMKDWERIGWVFEEVNFTLENE